MNAQSSRIRDLPPAERSALVAAAAAALREGNLVILPTETVYGIAASAQSSDAVAHLMTLTSARTRIPNEPLTWHAPSAQDARELLAPIHATHRRLMRRLLPGPVTFILEASPETLARAAATLSPVKGAIIQGSDIAVRVPDHPIAAAILAQAGIPVIATSIAGAGWGAGAELSSAARTSKEIAIAIDDGPTRLGRPSTPIRLGAGGTLTIGQGALDERFVLNQLERNILFVCTGNTCRSPMAAAIARDLLSRQPPGGIVTRVRSAGTFTEPGQPATTEAAIALRRLGIDMGPHASSELTRELIGEAELILTMTREHAAAVTAMDPAASAKVLTLDPSGQPVPDPIGSSQDVYDRAAAQIRDLLSVRLTELDP